jgi:hypothetical protein
MAQLWFSLKNTLLKETDVALSIPLTVTGMLLLV